MLLILAIRQRILYDKISEKQYSVTPERTGENAMSNAVQFRVAEREDTPLILDFIKALAEYEKMSDDVVADEALLEEWIFDKQKAEVIFALEGETEVGFALFFHNFSTFLGRVGIYLEDLYRHPMEEWTTFRVTGNTLKNLAE